MGSEFENLVAVVLSEAEQLKDPFTVEDLATRLGVSKDKPLKDIESALERLCMIGMVTHRGDGWLLSEFAQDDKETPQNSSTRMEQRCAPAIATNSALSHPVTESCSSNGQVMVSNTRQIARLSSDVVSYDCDDKAVQGNMAKLKCIVEVLKSSSSPLRGLEVAQKTGIGKSKGDVNRYLYFLQKKGILSQMGNTWKFERNVDDTDYFVYSAELAKVAPSKKQKARSGMSSASSSTCEYGCEKSTGNCIHIKQENHFHQYNVQVGDNSRFEIHAHGGEQFNRDVQGQGEQK